MKKVKFLIMLCLSISLSSTFCLGAFAGHLLPTSKTYMKKESRSKIHGLEDRLKCFLDDRFANHIKKGKELCIDFLRTEIDKIDSEIGTELITRNKERLEKMKSEREKILSRLTYLNSKEWLNKNEMAEFNEKLKRNGKLLEEIKKLEPLLNHYDQNEEIQKKLRKKQKLLRRIDELEGSNSIKKTVWMITKTYLGPSCFNGRQIAKDSGRMVLNLAAPIVWLAKGMSNNTKQNGGPMFPKEVKTLWRDL